MNELPQPKYPRSVRQKIWQIRRIQKLLRRKQRVARRGPGYQSSHVRLEVNDHTRKSIKRTEKQIELTLPERLDFDENYEATASHFAALRAATKNRFALSRLGFEKITYVSPSAALVLASEVDRWNHLIGGQISADVGTWQEQVKRLLSEMGYFELLKLVRPPEVAISGDTTFLPFRRGMVTGKSKSDLKKQSGQLAKELRIDIEGIVGSRIKRHFLFEGLSEAITNVVHHAYRQDESYKTKRWWLSASYARRERRLCVMFYDQGQGIPVTLPNASFFDQIRDFFTNWADSQKIQAAMKMGKTSTREQERGKGLQNLIGFAKAHSKGSLLIYSLRGAYKMSWSNDGREELATDSMHDYENSIGGTLIEWTVHI